MSQSDLLASTASLWIFPKSSSLKQKQEQLWKYIKDFGVGRIIFM